MKNVLTCKVSDMKLKDCVMLISMCITEVAVNMKKFRVFGCWRGGILNVVVTFRSLVVTLHTTRFNIQQFCMVFTLLLMCCVCTSEKKNCLPYMTLTNSFFITGGES